MSCTFEGTFTAENKIPMRGKKGKEMTGEERTAQVGEISWSHLFNTHWAYSSKSVFKNPGSIAHLFLPV